MKKLTILLLFIAVFITLPARRERTTVKGKLRPATTELDEGHTGGITPREDTLTVNLDRLIHLSGYDKPVNASRETLHASNLMTDSTLTGMTFLIRYLDRQGRELHRREVSTCFTAGPLETVIVSFPTWDIQRSFYYMRSVKPRRLATPYDVDLTLLSATIACGDSI